MISGDYVVGQDAEGQLWTAGNGQILRYDDQQDGGKRFQPLPGEYPGMLRCIRSDREGRLWFAFGGAGGSVYCLDGDRSCRIDIRDSRGFPVCDIFQDREGLLWFATWGGGISRCDPHVIHLFGRKEQRQEDAPICDRPIRDQRGRTWMGIDSVVRVLLQDRHGRIWMGLQNGMARLDSSGLSVWRDSVQGMRGDLCEDRSGNLWRGGPCGLTRWDEEQSKSVDSEGRDQRPGVTAITLDHQGRLLFCHDNPAGDTRCITRYDGRSFQLLLQCPKEGPESCFTCILPTRKGHLWIALGGYEGRIGHLAGLGRLEEDGKVTWYRSAEGLVDPRIKDLCEDDQGRLWIATRGGISCFDPRQNNFTNFTPENGLPVGALLCICRDRRGDLWFGAEDGVVRYDVGKRFQIIRSPHIRGSVGCIIEDREGYLWFATSHGVVRYLLTQIPPKVRLLRIIADRTYAATDIVEVPVSSGQVIFEFRGLSLRTPIRDLLYEYRLRGFDDDWQQPTRETRIAYPELPPGDYHFEVKAIDRDLNESTSASVEIRVILDPRIQGLTEALGSAAGTVDFIGNSPALRRVQAQLTEVAKTDLTVLILGETGTGKGLAARTVHAMSTRADGPFIQINCGTLPEALVESELFGHEKGAFTGAHARKLGRIELAQGGTLFLDEIGDMSLEAQVKLLRLLEEGTFERVGGELTKNADVRIVAATNRDLEQLVQDRRFRADLFYRLQVFPVLLPPLRERREDIELLALYFAERMAAHLGKQITDLAPEALAALRAGDWPGNVRELEHAVQRAVVICRDETVRAEDISLERGKTDPHATTARLTPEEYERQYIQALLEETDWTISGSRGAAARLGVPESSLRYRIKNWDSPNPEKQS